MKKVFHILFLLFCVSCLGAQTLYDIKGNVSSVDGPLFGVVVIVPDLELLSVSDADGNFSVKSLPQGEWKMEFRLMGYRTDFEVVAVPQDKNLDVRMQLESYELDDVTVTARHGSGMSTSSVIDRTAFEHQQTVSLSDALQLLPGGVTNNPSLNERSTLALREVDSNDATSAMGTSLLIDNVQISNDANMQVFSSASSKVSDFPNATGGGVDTRVVSTDRIESVEVVRGVASAEYGNMTSGAVMVKTRAGVSPLNVTLKVDPKLKSVSVGRGMLVGNRGAVVAADIDYANSYKDVRSNSTKFNRVTAQLAYSDVYNIADTKILFNGKLSGYISNNSNESDPDKLSYEYVDENCNSLRLNMNANWLLNKPWLTSLRFTASASTEHQVSEVLNSHVAELPTPYTTVLDGGLNEGAFYPEVYDEIMTVDGKPQTLQMKLSSNIAHSLNRITGSLLAGVEYNLKGNNGEGKSGSFLPTGVRPRSFKDVPFIGDVSFFAEEKLRLSMNNSRLELQMGGRFTKVMAKEYDFDMCIEPRLNLRFVMKDKPLSTWALRAGIGAQYKMPTLAHLYPDPAYHDVLSYSYIDNATQKGTALFSTLVLEDTRLYCLDLPRSVNYEIGLEVKQGAHFNLVASLFREVLDNGFSFASDVWPMSYRVYVMTSEPAEFVDGVLSVGGKEVPYKNEVTFMNFLTPTSNLSHTKNGVEFTMDFGKIECLNTQIMLDGIYLDVKRTDYNIHAYYTSGTINGENRKWAAACYGKSIFNVSHNKRFNTNLRLITRIPSVGFVFSFKGQCVWIDKQRKSVTSPITEIDGVKVVEPLAYVNENREFVYGMTMDEETMAHTSVYLQRLQENALLEDAPKPYAMADVRITKEIGQWLQLSVYANNFTNSKPQRYLKSSDQYVYKNTDIYFGCDMRIKL